MRQSHGDRTMIVRPPYDASMFESAVLCCILFYTFEVPSQLKMSSCTCLVHEFPKIHKDHTAYVQSLHSVHTEAARASCDILAISMHGCGDSTMTARSPNGLSTALHRSDVETRQRNHTMTKCKNYVTSYTTNVKYM